MVKQKPVINKYKSLYIKQLNKYENFKHSKADKINNIALKKARIF